MFVPTVVHSNGNRAYWTVMFVGKGKIRPFTQLPLLRSLFDRTDQDCIAF